MRKLSRKKRGRKTPFEKFLAQLPANSLDRKRATEWSSKTEELFANLDADFLKDMIEGREPDHRKAIEMAVSNFAFTCETGRFTVHNHETARAFERDFAKVIEKILAVFEKRLRRLGTANTIANELYRELNLRLLTTFSEARSLAWRSLQTDAGEPRGRKKGSPIDGEKLRALRKGIDPPVSQEKLAEKSQLSVDTIQRAESGHSIDKNTPDRLVNALVAFGVPRNIAESIQKPQK